MISLNPTQVPKAATDHLTALMQIIADPKAAQQHLAHILEEQKKLAKQRAELMDAVKQHEAELDNAHAEHQKWEADMTAREAELARLDKVRADAEQKQTIVERDAQHLVEREKSHNEREAKLHAERIDLIRRENAVAARENALMTREAKIAEAEQDYERRIENLRALTA